MEKPFFTLAIVCLQLNPTFEQIPFSPFYKKCWRLKDSFHTVTIHAFYALTMQSSNNTIQHASTRYRIHYRHCSHFTGLILTERNTHTYMITYIKYVQETRIIYMFFSLFSCANHQSGMGFWITAINQGCIWMPLSFVLTFYLWLIWTSQNCYENCGNIVQKYFDIAVVHGLSYLIVIILLLLL